MASPRYRRPILAALLICTLAGGMWISRHQWLGWFGSFLDTGGPPVHSDVIVVLAGGWTGERVLKAAELVNAGFAPTAILDSPRRLMYGASECRLAREFAVRAGQRDSLFECLEMDATSTREEAARVAVELRRRGVKRCLVVSVRNHLRRAERIFRREMPDIELHFTGAEHPFYRLESWYETREGRKAIFLEWLKAVTEPFGV